MHANSQVKFHREVSLYQQFQVFHMNINISFDILMLEMISLEKIFEIVAQTFPI